MAHIWLTVIHFPPHLEWVSIHIYMLYLIFVTKISSPFKNPLPRLFINRNRARVGPNILPAVEKLPPLYSTFLEMYLAIPTPLSPLIPSTHCSSCLLQSSAALRKEIHWWYMSRLRDSGVKWPHTYHLPSISKSHTSWALRCLSHPSPKVHL